MWVKKSVSVAMVFFWGCNLCMHAVCFSRCTMYSVANCARDSEVQSKLHTPDQLWECALWSYILGALRDPPPRIVLCQHAGAFPTSLCVFFVKLCHLIPSNTNHTCRACSIYAHRPPHLTKIPDSAHFTPSPTPGRSGATSPTASRTCKWNTANVFMCGSWMNRSRPTECV